MSDLLAGLGAYASSEEDQPETKQNPETNDNKPIETPIQNGTLKKQSYNSTLLGKRTHKEDDDDSEEFDLMKKARVSIAERSKQEQRAKAHQRQDNKNKLDEEETRQKLQNVDPIAQKLFSMLPPAKSSKDLTISSALHKDKAINIVAYKSDEDDKQQEDLEGPASRQKKDNLVDVSGASLVDKEEFYRNQLKKHSLKLFRDQTMARMQQFEDAGNLAQKGRAKNQLAAMGSDQLDLLTSYEDQSSKNRDEFRAKKSRYGW